MSCVGDSACTYFLYPCRLHATATEFTQWPEQATGQCEGVVGETGGREVTHPQQLFGEEHW